MSINMREQKDKGLIELANDYLAPVRKNWGMHLQIGVDVRNISPDVFTFSVDVGKPFNRKYGFETEELQRNLVYNVRNSLLGQLGDLVPCPKFEAVYFDDVQSIREKEFNGPFYDPSQDEFSLQSNIVSIKKIVLKEREKYRAVFRKAWDNIDF